MAALPKRVTITALRKKKLAGERIVAMTAHDALSAAAAQAAGCDLVLAGDSLGMTSLGFETTLSVTLEMMLHHAAAVARAAKAPLLVGDMPFMTYKISPEQALANCARMFQEGGMQAVKIEGGVEMAPTISRLAQAGLPVMAHIGLLPQSVHAQGGYTVQGRDEAAVDRLVADARALESAGAFSIVLEGMPASAAARVTKAVAIPTIGIGAGPGCDGQILVFADALGMDDGKPPKFVKRYADLHAAALEGLRAYAADVREGRFPGPEHCYAEKPD